MDTILFTYDVTYDAEVKVVSILAGFAGAVWSLAAVIGAFVVIS